MKWFRRLWRGLKRNVLIMFFATILLGILVLFCFLLDALYSEEKKEIIIREEIGQLEQTSQQISEAVDATMQQVGIADLGAVDRALAERFRSILEQKNIIFRIEVLTNLPGGEAAQRVPRLVVESQEKFRRLNRWENNLFSRSFSRFGQRDSLIGKIRYYYTTPLGQPHLQELTLRYRLYVALFVLLLLGLFLVMMRAVFLPVRGVVSRLEQSEQATTPQVLAYPQADIERAYNLLARAALVQRIGAELNDWVSTWDSTAEGAEESALKLACTQALRVLKLSRAFDWAAAYEVAAPPELEGPTGGTAVAAFGAVTAGVSTDRPHTSALIRAGQKLVGYLLAGRGEGLSEYHTGLLGQVAEQIELALLRLAGRRLLLEQQQNEISIALSTSMGHDLTNMIATSKWDLQTLQLGLQRLRIPAGERQLELFQQSLEGLLNNTRLLQEVVDLYRSLAFTKKPQYEECELNRLIQDVADLFHRSVSGRIDFRLELSPDSPTGRLEPRLLKLAVFNLLSNAKQAIGRYQDEHPEEEPPGEVVVETRQLGADLLVQVRDNGTGIVNREGQKLSEREINRIFQAGYSTKGVGAGSGLGLSWVQTIVQNFHHGSVQARNLPEHGAEITLRFPASVESA